MTTGSGGSYYKSHADRAPATNRDGFTVAELRARAQHRAEEARAEHRRMPSDILFERDDDDEAALRQGVPPRPSPGIPMAPSPMRGLLIDEEPLDEPDPPATNVYPLTLVQRAGRISNAAPEPLGPSEAERRLAGASLNLAALLADGVRKDARVEWKGEQRAAEREETSSVTQRVRFSIGLVRAAVQIRMSRMASPGVTYFEGLVRSERRTRRAVAVTMVLAATYIFHAEGLTGVIADIENLLGGGAALYGAAHWRRKALAARDEIAGHNPDSD